MSVIDITREGGVAIVEMRRPPNNFFDQPLIASLADAFEGLDRDGDVRCIVLCAEGKNFCAGANFAPAVAGGEELDPSPLYKEALRLFATNKPIVAAVQGAAIGGGLGLALMADFRVAGLGSRFSANFNRLGIHPGFGLSVTLPRLVGIQHAARLLYTGRTVVHDEALALGLVDDISSGADPRSAAMALATEIALSAPLAVAATRHTLRGGLLEAVASAVERESAQQKRQFRSKDFKEGVRAVAERRPPHFTGL